MRAPGAAASGEMRGSAYRMGEGRRLANHARARGVKSAHAATA